jgi:ribosomal protein S18 acetylase RimI-like enzyme
VEGVGADGLKIRQAVELDGAAQAAFRRIYEDSFPPDQRDEPDILFATVASGRRLCYLAERGGAVAGLAVLLPLLGEEVTYLEYLAVDGSVRSRGVGGHLLEHVLARLAQGSSSVDGIVFEVEPPDEAEGSERLLRARRIAFYERHGATAVSCAPHYRVPALSADHELSFTLMWLPGRLASPPVGPSSRAVCARF